MKLYAKIIATSILLLLTCFCFFADSLGLPASWNRPFQSLLPDNTTKMRQKLRPQAYVSWVEDPANGLIGQKTIGEFNFQAFYKPLDYLAITESLHPGSKSETEQIKKTYAGMHYFTFKIRCDEISDELLKYKLISTQDYYNRLDYYSFKAQHDFSLFNGKDTLACELFHFERTFGLAPIITFVIGFPDKGKTDTFNSDLVLSFDEKVFGSGNIRIRFDRETLNTLPQPDFN